MDRHSFGRDVDIAHDFSDGGNQDLIGALADDVNVVASGLENLGNRAEVASIIRPHLEPHDLVPEVLVGSQLHGFTNRNLDVLIGECRGDGGVVDAGQLQDRRAAIEPSSLYLIGAKVVAEMNGVQLKKTIREVSQNLDAQITGQTNWPEDVTDHQKADLLTGRGARTTGGAGCLSRFVTHE